MKKFHVITLILLSPCWILSSHSFAQKNKGEPVQLPISEETKLITYTEVVMCNGTQKELYDRALIWYKTFFKNPTDVIRKQDPENGMIQGIARFKIFNKHKKKEPDTDAGNVAYTVIVYVKDNRYKYDLSKFNQVSVSYYPIEKWMDTSSKTYSIQFDNYLIQTDEYAKKLIENIKNYMGTKPEEKKEGW